jgi:hypothetical protein
MMKGLAKQPSSVQSTLSNIKSTSVLSSASSEKVSFTEGGSVLLKMSSYVLVAEAVKLQNATKNSKRNPTQM